MRVTIIAALSFAVSLTSACNLVTSQPNEAGADSSREGSTVSGTPSKDYGQPVRLAELEDSAIRESSGLAASRRNPDLFWTHNDSGDGPFLYAFDRRGEKRGVWRVSGAKAYDWEDMAAGPGPQPGQSYLYVGDIGDNDKERREIIVYRLVEPVVTAADADSSKSEPRQTEAAEAIRLRYPDGAHDAEALAVHPASGDLYIITKTGKVNTAAGVYKLAAPFSATTVNILEKAGDLGLPSLLPGMVTGADISPDGRRIVVCDYFSAYEVSLPDSARGRFDDLWSQTPLVVRLGSRQQGEAVCYRLDGLAILATSEARHSPLIEVSRTR